VSVTFSKTEFSEQQQCGHVKLLQRFESEGPSRGARTTILHLADTQSFFDAGKGPPEMSAGMQSGSETKLENKKMLK
jgi:hypothetical protein